MCSFCEHTMGRILVMGRKTYEGMGDLLLPYRHIITLTTQPNFRAKENAEAMHLIDGLLAYSQTISEDVYVSGGGRISQGLLSCTGRVWWTSIDSTFGGDTYTGDIDSSDFALIKEYEGIMDQGNLYAHRSRKWERVRNKVASKEE